MSEPPTTPPTGEPRPHPRRPVRSVPSSRAYWELKAEQMMNRIFDPEAVLDLPVADAPPPSRPPAATTEAPPAAPPALPPRRREPSPPPRRGETPVLLLSLLGGVCMVSAISTSLYLASWNQAQQNLRQERNLLLVERLRSLGPINPPPVPAAPQLPAPTPLAPAPLPAAAGSAAAPAGEELPPPPEEPWMEDLSQLPEPGRPAPTILRVPVSPRLAASAPPPRPIARPAARPLPVAPPPPVTAVRPAAPAPVLVGVVAAAGRSGSAIFQVGSITTSVGIGEAIGTSGWRLRATGGDSAEIERDGEVRRVSISTGG